MGQGQIDFAYRICGILVVSWGQGLSALHLAWVLLACSSLHLCGLFLWKGNVCHVNGVFQPNQFVLFCAAMSCVRIFWRAFFLCTFLLFPITFLDFFFKVAWHSSFSLLPAPLCLSHSALKFGSCVYHGLANLGLCFFRLGGASVTEREFVLEVQANGRNYF